jgi:hypothetical protein
MNYLFFNIEKYLITVFKRKFFDKKYFSVVINTCTTGPCIKLQLTKNITVRPNPTASIYNATGSLARLESIFLLYFEKRSGLLKCWL